LENMQIERNKKIGLAVIGIIVLVGVFFSGMVYGRSSQSRMSARGQGGQAFGAGGNFTGRGGAGGVARNSGGFTIGQIIAKDDKSITVQIMNGGPAAVSQGGSKIIFLDANTKISKSAAGTVDDLATGTQVSVTGTPNADGSINAQMVQIRPTGGAR
jgi:hypothetical protein